MKMQRLVGALAAGACAACSQGQVVTYDAASGQGPASQCWTYSAGGSGPSPSDGVLDFGSGGTAETRYFSRTDLAPYHFTGRLTATMRVQVVSGNYAANPCGAGQRASVGLGWVDAEGRHLTVGLGSDRVYISTENNGFSGASNPSVAYAWGGVMRDVRVEVDNLTFTLFIDETQVLTVTRPAMPTGQSTAGMFYFGGDLTSCNSGHGRLERVGVTAAPTGDGNISVSAQPPSTVRWGSAPRRRRARRPAR